MTFDLTGKVAVVTGSTKGIGRAMVQGLAEAGASVVVSSRKQDLCDARCRRDRGDDRGRGVRAGRVTSANGTRFPRSSTPWWNGSAGSTSWSTTPASARRGSGVSEMTLDLWRKIFAVNLEGPLRMSQCVAPVMRDGGGGSIINIGSMAAYHAGSAVCAYGASKAALLNISRTMAQEWAGWNVRVNVLSPGPFASDMVEGAERNAPGFKDLIASGTLMKRVAKPEEIVGPVVYLASDASSFVTGDDISVSGGMAK